MRPAQGIGFIYLSLLFDRIGKGIRSSPRDALIIDHTPPSVIHYAFGVHRSMDAVGALLGPLLATAILFFFNQNFQFVFIISLIFGVLGLLSFGFFVHDKIVKLASNNNRVFFIIN